MIRGYDSGRSHLLPFEATQHTKKRQTHIPKPSPLQGDSLNQPAKVRLLNCSSILQAARCFPSENRKTAKRPPLSLKVRTLFGASLSISFFSLIGTSGLVLGGLVSHAPAGTRDSTPNHQSTWVWVKIICFHLPGLFVGPLKGDPQPHHQGLDAKS